MKNLVKVLFIIIYLSVFGGEAFAQVSATMQVTARVISGASVDYEEPVIQFEESKIGGHVFNTDFLSIVIPSHANVSISVQETSVFQNTEGDTIQLEGLTLLTSKTKKGFYSASLKGKVKDKPMLQGSYRGSITTVIEYL